MLKMVITAGKCSVECVYNVSSSLSGMDRIHINVSSRSVKGSNSSALGLKRCALSCFFFHSIVV